MSIDASIEEIKRATAAAIGASTVANADITTASGGYNIDLVGAAALLRLETPITDMIPRNSADGGLSAQWHEIMTSSGRANNSMGTASEGQRGGQLGYSGTLRTAAYKQISIDAAVTDEQRLATQGIFDPFALNLQAALVEAKRSHHMQNLFGRGSTGLGTAATPNLATATTGGTIGAATQSVIVVALTGAAAQRVKTYTLNGSWTASASSGAELLDSTRTNGDLSTTTVSGGTSIKSAAATQATTGSTSTLTVTWAPTKGAAGYALFVGVAGSEVFQGFTTLCSVTLTLLKTGSQAAASNFTVDKGLDALEYDGIITQLCDSASPAYYQALANGSNSLTSNAKMSIDQIEPALAYMYRTFDGYSPEFAFVGGATAAALGSALMSNATASRGVVMLNAGAPGGTVDVGTIPTAFVNPYTQTKIKIVVDPYMPEGKVILGTIALPTRFAGSVNNAIFFRARREFYGETWTRTTRKWANAVTLDGALAMPWRAGWAVVDNVLAS